MSKLLGTRLWVVPCIAMLTVAVTAGPGTASGADPRARARVALHPSVNVSPSTVAPGGALTISGSNWPARRAVRLYLGRPLGEDTVLEPVALVKADSRGRFHKRLWTATTIPPGSYSIEACRRECLLSAKADFRVQAPAM